MEKDLAQHPALCRGGAARAAAGVAAARPRGGGAQRDRARDADPRGPARARTRAGGATSSARWDAVLLPRVWRYVDALPRNAAGQAAARVARRALRAARPGRDRSTRSRAGRAGSSASSRFPAISSIWTGTTTGSPLVAAVVELRWVMEAAFDLLGRTPRVSQFEVLKFPEVLLPGQTLRPARRAVAGRRPARLPAVRGRARVRVGPLPADRRARERRVEAVPPDSDLRPQGRHRSGRELARSPAGCTAS